MHNVRLGNLSTELYRPNRILLAISSDGIRSEWPPLTKIGIVPDIGRCIRDNAEIELGLVPEKQVE